MRKFFDWLFGREERFDFDSEMKKIVATLPPRDLDEPRIAQLSPGVKALVAKAAADENLPPLTPMPLTPRMAALRAEILSEQAEVKSKRVTSSKSEKSKRKPKAKSSRKSKAA